MSMVIPVLDGLRHLLSTTSGGLDVLRGQLIKQLDDRFGDVFEDDDLCVATMIDPRFKATPFDSEDRRRRAVNSTLAAVSATVAQSAVPSSSSVTAAASVSVTATLAPAKPSLWDKLDRAAASQVTATSTASAAGTPESMRHELEAYCAEQPLERSQSPFLWWREHDKRFPAAATVARRYLCIPATSVPTERLFSTAGDVITKKRNSLKPAKAEKVIFVMNNL